MQKSRPEIPSEKEEVEKDMEFEEEPNGEEECEDPREVEYSDEEEN